MTRKLGQGQGESKSSPRRVTAKVKAERAAALRIAGLTYPQIAEQVGYRSRGAAHRAVQRVLAERTEATADELYKVELLRLERLHAAFWTAALNGGVAAADRLLSIARRRAALAGIDFEARQKYIDPGSDIDRFLAHMIPESPEEVQRATVEKLRTYGDRDPA